MGVLKMPCGDYAVFHKKEHFYLRLPDNKWSCPDCNPKLARDLQKRMEQSEANNWNIKTHITLTVAGLYESGVICEAFNDLLTFMRRGGNFTFTTYHGYPKTVSLHARPNLKYIRMNEIQPDRLLNFGESVYHIHFVVNQYITKFDVIPIWNHALKLHGSKSVFNYVEDTHPHNFNAGKYLMKYMTKMEHQELFDKGDRRYGCSRGVIPSKPVKLPSGNYEFMSLEKARLVLEWFNPATTPRDKEIIERQLGFDSRFDGSIIHKIAYGY